MTVLRERIDTALPLERAFAFVADFANAERWDPGVATSVRTNAGPVGVGARYRLGVRMGGRIVPMDYEVTAFDAPRRRGPRGLVAAGSDAIDEIRFSRDRWRARGSTTWPTSGWSACSASSRRSPAARSARIGRDARLGMERALERRRRGPDERWTSRSSAPGSAGSPPRTRSAATTG